MKLCHASLLVVLLAVGWAVLAAAVTPSPSPSSSATTDEYSGLEFAGQYRALRSVFEDNLWKGCPPDQPMATTRTVYTPTQLRAEFEALPINGEWHEIKIADWDPSWRTNATITLRSISGATTERDWAALGGGVIIRPVGSGYSRPLTVGWDIRHVGGIHLQRLTLARSAFETSSGQDPRDWYPGSPTWVGSPPTYSWTISHNGVGGTGAPRTNTSMVLDNCRCGSGYHPEHPTEFRAYINFFGGASGRIRSLWVKDSQFNGFNIGVAADGVKYFAATNLAFRRSIEDCLRIANTRAKWGDDERMYVLARRVARWDMVDECDAVASGGQDLKLWSVHADMIQSGSNSVSSYPIEILKEYLLDLAGRSTYKDAEETPGAGIKREAGGTQSSYSDDSATWIKELIHDCILAPSGSNAIILRNAVNSFVERVTLVRAGKLVPSEGSPTGMGSLNALPYLGGSRAATFTQPITITAKNSIIGISSIGTNITFVESNVVKVAWKPNKYSTLLPSQAFAGPFFQIPDGRWSWTEKNATSYNALASALWSQFRPSANFTSAGCRNPQQWLELSTSTFI